MKTRSLLTLSAAVLLAVGGFTGFAAQRATAQAAAEPESTASLDDLAWLAGSWEGEGLGGRYEEIWSAPAGGNMIGMFRLVRDGKVALSEFIMIEQREDGIHFMLKHYAPGWQEWETDAPLTFKLSSAANGTFVFDASGEQSARRVSYVRDEKGGWKAIIERVVDGNPGTLEVPFRRAS